MSRSTSLIAMDSMNLMMFEQPLAWEDIVRHAALQRMLDSETAYVLNVMTPYAEHVLPFIPAGRTVADMKY